MRPSIRTAAPARALAALLLAPRLRSLLAPLLTLPLVACSLSPRPDTSRYFTLPEPAAEAGAPAGRGAPPATGLPQAAVPTFGLGPVGWPAYLSRPEVATRVSATEVAYAGNDRWAGPLDELTLGVLATELRARVPARDVVHWPWPLASPPAVAATVEFVRFEADRSGGATLVARWTVTVPGGPPVSGETRASEPGTPGDVAGSVATQGRLIGRLADDLAAAARPPPASGR